MVSSVLIKIKTMKSPVMTMKFSSVAKVTIVKFKLGGQGNILKLFSLLATPQIETTAHLECSNATDDWYFDLTDQPQTKAFNIRCNEQR